MIVKDQLFVIMKRNLSILCLLFGLFVCATVFSACGGDGDEPSSGVNNGSSNNNQTPSNDQTPSTPQSSKHVAKIITEEGSSFYESSFTYDSQGRVIKVTETQSGTGTNSHSETEYQYGEMLIISKMKGEGTYSNGQSFTRTESHSYTLENGRIVKDEEKQNGSSSTETFSYDANNYLSSISSKGSDNESGTKITWSDGNLIKLGNRSFEYSNYPWVKGFPLYLKSSNMDANLFAIGYYGNIPKNLPSKTIASETSGYTYDYTFEGSYVTKVVITPFVENNKSHKSISTIIWE